MRPEGKKIPPPKLLITTNLDNDDAFSSDVVELLQRELRPAPGKRIYSLLYGYQYFTDRRFALKMRYTNNHFLTLVEPFDAHTETIISYRHTKAIRQLPTTYLSTARGKWLEIVHEDNVSNDFRINIKVWYIPLLYGRSFADFGLGGFRLSCARQWAATLLVVPARFFARHSSEFFFYDIKQLTSPLPPAPAICKFVVEIERIHKHHVQAADPVFRRSVIMFSADFSPIRSKPLISSAVSLYKSAVFLINPKR